MIEPKSLLLVGKVRPERKRSLTGMAVSTQMPLVSCEDSSEAIAWLERNTPACLVVDAGAPRLDKVISHVRSKPQLAHVPVFALVSTPDDLWIEQYFSWGGDDVVQVDAGATLLERLRAVPREVPPTVAGRRVTIAESDRTRLEVLGRVFRLAGFETDYVTERAGLEAAIQKFDPGVVVANAALGELTLALERTRAQGVNAGWAILAARREIDSQLISLGSLTRCFVAGVQSNPWQLLTRVNDLLRREPEERRREPRLALGSFVLFRAAGSDDDEVGVLHNLSSNGMCVRTYAPVTSDEVWLEWRVPQDKTRVRLEGKVAWRQSSLVDPYRAAAPLGFGVEFRDYLGGARKHLERALEVLEAGARRSSASQSVAPAASSRRTESSGADAAAPSLSEAPPATNRFPSIKPLTDTLSFGKGSAKSAAPTTQPTTPTGPGGVTTPDGKKGVLTRPQQPGVATSAAAGSPSASKGSPKATLFGTGSRLAEPASDTRAPPTVSETQGRRTAASERPAARPAGEEKPARSGSTPPGPIDRGDKPGLVRQPPPPSAVRLSAPQVPRFDAPPRPKGTAGVIAAPPRPGRLNATMLGMGSTAVDSDATTASASAGAPAALAPAGATRPASTDATTGPASTGASAASGSVGTTGAASTTESLERSSPSALAVDRSDSRDSERKLAPAKAELTPSAAENSQKAGESSKNDGLAPFEIGAGNTQAGATFGPDALFEIAEDSLPPAAEVHDDAPTVVAATPTFSIEDDRARDETEFNAEEAETRQFNAAAFRADSPPFREPVMREVVRSHAVSPDEYRVPPALPIRKIVLGLTVAIVGMVAGGLWLYRADLQRAPKESARSDAAPIAPTPSSSAAIAASSAPLASASATPVATAAATAAATSDTDVPIAPLDEGGPLDGYPPVEEFQLGNGRNLADRYGYLVVRFPEAAFIFSNNIAVGATNWKIATTCGEKVLRIGVGEKPVTWLSQDMKVNVACRDTTRVVFRRLEGVVAPAGVQRPISPTTSAARKAPKPEDGADSALRSTSPAGDTATPSKSMDAKPSESHLGESQPGDTAPAPVRSAESAPVTAPVHPAVERERGTTDDVRE